MEEKQTLKQWLDDLEAQCKEVKVRWEGGNDDGSFWASIDDVDIDTEGNSIGGRLVDIVADHIGYGSFAGDFSTNGELIYENGHMTGTDFYSTTESNSEQLEEDKFIKIEIPEYLWFDTLTINTEGNVEDGGLSISVSFNITNGPVVDEHNTLEDEISDMIDQQILERLQNLDKVNYVYNDWRFRFDEAEIIDGKRVFFIEEVDYSYEDSDDKEICIEITDDAEEQAEQRRREEEERWKKMQEEWNKNKS